MSGRFFCDRLLWELLWQRLVVTDCSAVKKYSSLIQFLDVHLDFIAAKAAPTV